MANPPSEGRASWRAADHRCASGGLPVARFGAGAVQDLVHGGTGDGHEPLGELGRGRTLAPPAGGPGQRPSLGAVGGADPGDPNRGLGALGGEQPGARAAIRTSHAGHPGQIGQRPRELGEPGPHGGVVCVGQVHEPRHGAVQPEVRHELGGVLQVGVGALQVNLGERPTQGVGHRSSGAGAGPEGVPHHRQRGRLGEQGAELVEPLAGGIGQLGLGG